MNIQRYEPLSLRIGGTLKELTHPLVMGILNVTPDSFFAESRAFTAEAVEKRVEKMLSDGADIIDVGGYSTRPGAAATDAEEEWRRVALGVAAAKRINPQVPVSVDTFRAEVARRAVEEYGADIINDVSGGDLDADMWQTVAELQVPYILMHMRGTPATMQELTNYDDVVADVLSDLLHKVDKLRAMGVSDIILDPGFGFAKTVEQNFRLLAQIDSFRLAGLPVLAGLSHKTMIWKTLGIKPDEALNGTVVLNTVALLGGADILRVHDVREGVETVKLIEMLRKAAI